MSFNRPASSYGRSSLRSPMLYLPPERSSLRLTPATYIAYDLVLDCPYFGRLSAQESLGSIACPPACYLLPILLGIVSRILLGIIVLHNQSVRSCVAPGAILTCPGRYPLERSNALLPNSSCTASNHITRLACRRTSAHVD